MQQPATATEPKYALIIGANGGIGQEVVKQMSEQQAFSTIFTVSRGEALLLTDSQQKNTRIVHNTIDTADEVAVKNFVTDLESNGIKLSLVICTTGILHQNNAKDRGGFQTMHARAQGFCLSLICYCRIRGGRQRWRPRHWTSIHHALVPCIRTFRAAR